MPGPRLEVAAYGISLAALVSKMVPPSDTQALTTAMGGFRWAATFCTETMVSRPGVNRQAPVCSRLATTYPAAVSLQAAVGVGHDLVLDDPEMNLGYFTSAVSTAVNNQPRLVRRCACCLQYLAYALLSMKC